MQQRIVVKNPSGMVVYQTNSLNDAREFIINHEREGLKGFKLDIEKI